MFNYTFLHEIINKEMSNKGLSLREFSEKSKINYGILWRIMNANNNEETIRTNEIGKGKKLRTTGNVTLGTIDLLCSYFKKNPWEILKYNKHALLDRNEIKRLNTLRVMSSSKRMTWATPQEWFNYLDLEFDFSLDPCSSSETAKCKKYYTPKEDGLSQSWAGERVFMNPPYGREIGIWMKKAMMECLQNKTLVVAFVPARLDTNWWHDYASKASEIRFPKGRVKNANRQSWTFPVAIVIFRPRI